MQCDQCGMTSAREKNLVATVTKMSEKRIIAEITEPQERLMSVRGAKPFAFGFWLREGRGEAEHTLHLCSLNCLRIYINETLKG